jgi:hypothetical protein
MPQAKVTTDKGAQESELNGQLLFLVKKGKMGIELYLERLNLTGTSVGTEKGSTGLLSLGLEKRVMASYSKTDEAQVKFDTNLHYPLIDRTEGYRHLGAKEQDNFIPFVAKAHGKMALKFEPRLEAVLSEDVMVEKEKEKRIQINLSLNLKIDKYYIKSITAVNIVVTGILILAFAFFNQLNIQPVFVRSGPTDTSPTGWSFDTMMQSAKCLWRKCCVFFNVRSPIFVDKAAYKILGGGWNFTDAIALMNEVNIKDAVEIFVASRFDPITDGCGATFSSGTANAKIVTCDEQLKVPDPNNPGKYLGAINVNHLAHELGHVMSLLHPGEPVVPPFTAAGTAGTVMEGSGFYADNPHAQSANNCTHVASPLFRITLMSNDSRCIVNPEIP